MTTETDQNIMGSAGGSLPVAQGVEPVDVTARFELLHRSRNQVITRAEEASALTIPHLFKRTHQGEDDTLPTPYQSVGARGVNNLSNKLLLTLFPTSSPFFKLAVPESSVKQAEGFDPNVKNQVEAELVKHEAVIQKDLEVNGFRHKYHEALRHLLVTGNFLIHIPAKGEPIGYSLDKYVVKRSTSGKVLEIIVREGVSFYELPKRWREQVSSVCNSDNQDVTKMIFEMYTRVYLEDGKYKEGKYIKNTLLEGSEASYPEKSSAWIPLRWTGASSEDYGRGYVEEYLGDLMSLEGLSKAVLQTSALASKTFGILRNGSTIRPKDIAEVPNGGVVQGNPEDIIYPEIGKYNDLRTAKDMIDTISFNLSQAFLITQVRDSERTTAEEIRMMANELETALGGAYSLLAKTMQEPTLQRERQRLTNSKALPQLNDEDIDPKIVVGLEGLGRGTDLDKLLRVANVTSQILPVAKEIPRFDQDKYTKFAWNAVGLEANSVLMSEEEYQAKVQAEQQQVLQQNAMDMTNSAISAGTKPLIEGAINQPEQTQQVVDNIRDSVQPQ